MSLYDTSNVGTATTTTLENKTITFFDMYENSAASMFVRVSVRNANNTTSGSFLLHGSACRATGNAVLQGQSTVSSVVPLGFALASVTLEASGSRINVVAHGALATALDWAASIAVVGEYDD